MAVEEEYSDYFQEKLQAELQIYFENLIANRECGPRNLAVVCRVTVLLAMDQRVSHPQCVAVCRTWHSVLNPSPSLSDCRCPVVP